MDNNISDIYLDNAVNTCPCCGAKITPVYLTHYSEDISELDIATYYVICKCPNNSCNEIFFVKYKGEYNPRNGLYGIEYDLTLQDVDIYPYSFPDDYFDKFIYEISPKFVETYGQSAVAENIGLNKICGSGYRLSLELLIKDFATFLRPDKAQEIKSDTSVANVIANQIPDKDCFKEIKDIAKRAWWLGCDSTHYETRYKDHDINDLKECIDITVATIVFYLKREHYLKTIQKNP